MAQAAQAGIGIEHQHLLDAWAAHYALKDDPLARVMRSGSMEILGNPAVSAGPPKRLKPELAAAADQGLRVMICLPLRARDLSLGLLCLFAPEASVLSAGEAELLGEMADDLALGIRHIRSRQEQRRIEAAVLKVAAGVSASTGAAFFEQLTRNMAEALGAHAAFVARLLPGSPQAASTIAAVLDGEKLENFDYLVTGTPCENLIDADNWIVPSKVARKYPKSPSLAALGAEAYVGRRLDSSCGRPLGVLFVLFRTPLVKTDFISSTLRIFAARAAAELERRDAGIRIHEQASLLDKAKDAIIVRDTGGLVRYWNKGAERLYGWTAAEALGQEIGQLLFADAAKMRDVTEHVLEQGEWTAELLQHHKDGRSLMIEAHWSLVRDESGRPDAIFSIDTDITQRKAIEREVQQLAFYDALTQLPNRRLLLDRLEHALANNARRGSIGALLFLDLDNFKTINDTLGHDTGDFLLQQVATRLSSCVRSSDTVARFGGDEFAVILENLSEVPEDAAAGAKDVAEKIIACLNQPTLRDNKACYSTPSIGIALFDAGQSDAHELINRADFAMYQAKATGRNTLRFFDPAMQARVAGRNALIAELQQALRDDQFVLHYQLQADSDGKPIGTEAQLYWRHPQRGAVHADEFIGLAEECGLILPLSKWVLDRACQQLVTWSRQPSLAPLHLAIDLSARQFQQSDFVAEVLAAIDRAGANPAQLKLQLTQSMLLEDLEDALRKTNALKAKGIGIGLNDFGVEYSSLSYLKRLPLEQLKINRAFVRDVLADPNDAAIASTLVALGKSLGLAVIAEGVDSAAQRDFLLSHGCKAYQGDLFAGPLPAARLEALLLEHQGA